MPSLGTVALASYVPILGPTGVSVAEGQESPYAGMTVNERLYVAGEMAAFDAAARARDRETMIAILALVDVPMPERTADSIIANPSKYGY